MKFRKKCIITVLNLICLVMCVGCFSDETDDKFKGENPYKEYAHENLLDQGYINYFKYEYAKELPQFWDESESLKNTVEKYAFKDSGYMVHNRTQSEWYIDNNKRNTNKIYYGETNFGGDLPDGKGMIFKVNIASDALSDLTFDSINFSDPNKATQDLNEKVKGGYTIFMGNFDDGIYSGYGKNYYDWRDLGKISYEIDQLPFDVKKSIANPISFEGYFKNGIPEGPGIEYYYNNLKLDRTGSKPNFTGRLIAVGGNYKNGKRDGNMTVYVQDNYGIGFKWINATYENGNFTGNATVWDTEGNVVSNGPFKNISEAEDLYDVSSSYVITEQLKKEQQRLNNVYTQAENILKNNNVDAKVLCSNYNQNTNHFLSVVQWKNDYKFLLFDAGTKSIATIPFSYQTLRVLAANSAKTTMDLTIINDNKDPKKNYDFNKGIWQDNDHTINIGTNWTREDFNSDNLGIRMSIPWLTNYKSGSRLLNYSRNIHLVRLFILNMPALKDNMAKSHIKIENL